MLNPCRETIEIEYETMDNSVYIPRRQIDAEYVIGIAAAIAKTWREGESEGVDMDDICESIEDLAREFYAPEEVTHAND